VVRRKKSVDFAAMLTRLERCDHQLLTLDLALQSLSQRLLFKPREAQSRAAFIVHMRDRLSRLRMVLTEDDQADSSEIDLGMPDLDVCTGPELAVIGEFLDSRLRILKDLHDNLSRYWGVITRAAQGRLGFVRGILTLSRLKSVLTNIASQSAQLNHEEKSLGEFNAKLVRKIGRNQEVRHLAGNVSGLIQLFEEIDAGSARIAKLKADIVREESRIEAMKAWLGKHDALKTEAPANVPLPPLAFARELEDGVKLPSVKAVERNSERLTLARRYVQDYLAKQGHQSDQQSPNSQELTKSKSPGHHAN
jgi:hypothetical protein